MARVAILAGLATAVLSSGPGPHYPTFTCGSVVKNNVTFINSDTDDYFAVINATAFTLVAKGWVTDPSSPACNPEVYVNFAPDGKGDFPVTQRGFQDGSFRLTVGPSTPPEPTWDMYFSGSGVCDYTVTLGEFTIEC